MMSKLAETRWTTCTPAIEPPLSSFNLNGREYAATQSVFKSPKPFGMNPLLAFPTLKCIQQRSSALCKCPTELLVYVAISRHEVLKGVIYAKPKYSLPAVMAV